MNKKLNKKLIKIMCLILSIIIFTLSPVGSYIQGENANAYGLLSIENEMANFLFPIVAYVASQQLAFNGAYDTLETTAANVKILLDELRTQTTALSNLLNAQSKVLLAKMYTSLDNFEINKMLGISYTTTEMSEIEQQSDLLKQKIINNDSLTNKDLKTLGVHDLLSNFFKNKIGKENIKIYDSSGLSHTNIAGVEYLEYTSSNYSVRSKFLQYDNTDFLKLINGKYNYKLVDGYFSSSSGRAVFNPYLTFKLFLSSTYYLTLVLSTPCFIAPVGNNNFVLLDRSNLLNGYYMEIYNTNGDRFLTYTFLNNVKNFINAIQPYTSTDLKSSDYYINSTDYDVFELLNLFTLGEITYIPKDIFLGQNSITGLTAKVLDDVDLPDTSQTQAERVIYNKAIDGTEYDNNITAIPNEQTGYEDIVIVPSDETILPTTSTADTNIEVPSDTGGSVSTDGKIFDFPIIGDLLRWLIKIWEMLKAIFNTMVQQSSTTGEIETGIDWGNFKGFFDIFYIFYYLIIVVILILIKFLAVVFSLFSVPANIDLFDAYPNILVGINYLKGLKVGGFNITIQQIFEYMFTIFFFLFVVTVLQKLYHSFSGIERQTIRQEQKWEDSSNTIFRDGNYINKQTGEIQDYRYK